tara:strand:+ start:3302 stop:3601 length:300 start_codon:yes stop_codon:yes gene_type:complete
MQPGTRSIFQNLFQTLPANNAKFGQRFDKNDGQIAENFSRIKGKMLLEMKTTAYLNRGGGEPTRMERHLATTAWQRLARARKKYQPEMEQLWACCKSSR